MTKLEKSLKQWVSNGLIDQQQANRIYQFELTQAHTSWILMSILILGALVAGLGVISIIAANWEQIPNYIKLIADFISLIVLSIFILRAWDLKKSIQFEILLLVFVILCFASIGLINQIYHTGGELYQALLLWSVIILPVALTARHMIVPLLCIGGFIFGGAWMASESPLFGPIFQNDFLAVLVTIPLLCGTFLVFSNKLGLHRNFAIAFEIWLFISGFIALIIVDQGLNLLTNNFTPYLFGYVFALLTIIGIIKNDTFNNIQKYLLIGALITYIIAFHLFMFHIQSPIVHAIFTIIILGLIAIFLASVQRRRLFQWILFFIGVRFLGIYFEALGGLAATGLGLIISGILIIAMAVLWYKYRQAVAAWVERWIR